MRPGTAQPSTTPPPAPPSSVISETHTQQPLNELSAPTDDVINSLFTKEPLDMDLLSELLGSLDGTAASTPTMNSAAIHAEDAMELGGITTAAVLDGLRSLDEFERNAAIHTDGYTHESVSHTPIDESELADSILRAANSVAHMDNGGLGSFNQAELSAALEQLYWGSLEVPAVDPMATTHGDAVDTAMLPAPTPAPTPMQIAGSPQIEVAMESATVWPSNATECSRDEAMDDETDDENPLELEELSLFSLFLSDMKAFEGFLDKLSLNQLRQCAATVNSVLVRRENAMNDPPPPKQSRIVQRRPSRSASMVDSTPAIHAGETTGAPSSIQGEGLDDALPVTTMSLLREWLPPSTADCVITALQAANLTNPTTARQPARQQHHHHHQQSMGTDQESTQAMRTDTNSQAEVPKTSGAQERTRADSSQTPSDVTLETDSEGVPWMVFSYVQKGKPKWHRIRIDVDRAPLHAIPQSFQKNNCVYPRANCHESAYTGNRWDYETTCNVFGWQLAFLNQELLSGRRGLLQSAVNKYRDKVEGHKSRRITRLEKSERSQRGKTNKRPLAKPQRQRIEKRQRVEGADPSVLAAFSAAGTSAAVAAAVANAVSELPRTLSLPQMASGVDGSGGLVSSAIGGLVASAQQLPSVSAPVTPVPVSTQSAQCLTVSLFVSNQFLPIDVDISFSKIDEIAPVAELRPEEQRQMAPVELARNKAEREQQHKQWSVREQFKQDHAVFPRVLDLEHSRYGGMPGRWEFELTCNEMAWKLALLNERLRYRMPLIQKCIDTYRTKFAQPPWGQLKCSDATMDKHVLLRFYDLWTPRPGRRRLETMPRDADITDEMQAVSHNTSLGSVQIQQAKVVGSAAKETAVVVQPAEGAGVERPLSASSTGSETAARLRIVRPKSSQPSSHSSSAAPSAALSQPQGPLKPSPQKQVKPRPQQPAVAIRPTNARPPVVQAPQVRLPPRPQIRPAQQQQQPQQQQVRLLPAALPAQPRPAARPMPRPQMRPAMRPRLPPSQSRPAPPSATSPRPRPHPLQENPRPLPSRPQPAASRPPLPPLPPLPPTHANMRPSATPTAAAVPRPSAATPHASRPPQAAPRPAAPPARPTPGSRSIASTPTQQPAVNTTLPMTTKSAKAQVAASVLTDVLRRFAKTDPALAQLTSVLKEPQGGSVQGASEEEEPLDAKVAELEKLLTELQK